MEDDDTPMHTLKIVVLDPSRRGPAVTLDDVALAVGRRLGLVPRATQKVVAAARVRRPAVLGRRPRLRPAPPPRRAHAARARRRRPSSTSSTASWRAATSPRDRAPWAMTLVHGLEGGRQAVVVRVHHAIVDGLGALNTFLAATTDEPGHVVDLAPPLRPRPRSSRGVSLGVARRWTRSAPGCALVGLVRRAAHSRRNARAYRDVHPGPPAALRDPQRTSLNAGSGDRARTCATGSLDLAHDAGHRQGERHDGQRRAPRGRSPARCEPSSPSGARTCRRRASASFGIASDRTGSDRRQGNLVTPAFVQLRNDLDDPLDRLDATARSCRAGVELRKLAGLDLTDRLERARAAAAQPRCAGCSTRRTNITPGHLVTANVPGAAHAAVVRRRRGRGLVLLRRRRSTRRTSTSPCTATTVG